MNAGAAVCQDNALPVPGVILLDSVIPRGVGDTGNPMTFPYRVLVETARLGIQQVLTGDLHQILPPLVTAGQRLIDRGASFLTTSCGLLSIAQTALSDALPVAIATSSLLQLPRIRSLVGAQHSVVVLTANTSFLRADHLIAAGIPVDALPSMRVIGLEHTTLFYPALTGHIPSVDAEHIRPEILDTLRRGLRDDPTIGAVLVECTNLCPYTDAIRVDTSLPVWDHRTLIESLRSTLPSTAPSGGHGDHPLRLRTH